jgi:hypothetical protein
MDAPGIPGMICMCHEKRGRGRGVYTTVVYNGGVLEERVDRGERNLFLRGGWWSRDGHVADVHDRSR